MAGLINWRRVSIPAISPDANHVYVGVDSSDGKLYIKDDLGNVSKYENTASINALIAAALTDYDLSTVVDSKISDAINGLIDGAPTTLDTLNELAAALNDDNNFASTVTTQLGLKYDASNPAGYQTAAQVSTASAAAVATHEAAADPHPQYLTPSEGNASYQPLDGDLTAVAGLSGAGFAVRTTTNTWATRSIVAGAGIGVTNSDGVFGSPSVSNSDRGSVAVASHEAAADPHPQYATDTDLSSGLALKYDASNPNGYETPTQLNSRDTANRNRANHTGTQAVGTITGLGALATKNTVGTIDIDNDSITSAKIGNSQVTSLKIANDAIVTDRILANAVTNSRLADMGANTLKGNNTGGVADPQDLTVAQVRTMLLINNLDNTSDLSKPISTATQSALDLKYNASNPNGYETPAQLDTRDAANRNRANHTGTQLRATISDFAHTHPLSELQQSGAAVGQVATWNGTSWVPQSPGGETILQTTAIQTFTLTAYTNITEFISPSLATGFYELRAYVIFQSTAAGTGVGLRLQQVGAAISNLNLAVEISQGGIGTDRMFQYQQVLTTEDFVATASSGANTNLVATLKGTFQVTSAGTVTLQMRSETGGTAVSVRPNSFLVLKRLA